MKRKLLSSLDGLLNVAWAALLAAPLLLAACEAQAPVPVAQAPLAASERSPAAIGAAAVPKAPQASTDAQDQDLARWRAELAAKQAARDARLAEREAKRAALMAQPDPVPSTRENPFAQRISCETARR